MHTDLAAHLHSPACNKLIEQLKACHENVSTTPRNSSQDPTKVIFVQHAFAKFIGICNSIDDQVVKCLKSERVARSAANRANARERQARYKERLQQGESN